MYVRLRVEEETYLSGVRVYPMGNSLDICVETDALTAGEASLTLTSDALADAVARRVDVKTRRGGAVVPGLTPGGECPALG